MLPPEFLFGEKDPWALSVFRVLQFSDGIKSSVSYLVRVY